jgi:hypothetical protein
MTPLAIAHRALKGDLNNSYCYKIGEDTLYWDNRDQTYTTYYGMMSRDSLTYISTVDEFNNFKGDNMKTVMDAVNEFKAKLSKHVNSTHTIYINPENDRWYFNDGLCPVIGVKVCKRDEFLATVAECEANFGQCKQSYSDYKALYNSVMGKATQAPVYTQEMTDNGVFPSAGMECLVLNNSCSQPKWIKALIKYMGDLVIYAYCEKGERCDRKRSLKFKPLTPPIELISGKAYQFDYGNTTEIIGLYSKRSKQLQAIAGHYESKHCANIKPLIVEGK